MWENDRIELRRAEIRGVMARYDDAFTEVRRRIDQLEGLEDRASRETAQEALLEAAAEMHLTAGILEDAAREIVLYLTTEKGVKGNQAARALGLSSTTVTRWIKRARVEE